MEPASLNGSNLSGPDDLGAFCIPGGVVVLVTWRDAWFDFDEPDPEDARADYLVKTIGFVVRDSPRFLSIAQEVLPDGDGFRAVTHIPKAVIEKVTPLEETLAAVVDPGTNGHTSMSPTF